MDPEFKNTLTQNKTSQAPNLTAAAVLFDESHSRGFKNTMPRHTSPEQREAPIMSDQIRPKTQDGRNNQMGSTAIRESKS